MRKKLAAVAAAALLAVTMSGCAPTYDGDVTGCTVNQKEAIAQKSGTDYRVFSDCGVFGVQDDIALGQWNSADTYGSIEVGKTYDFEAYGWRNGFFSTFPNITAATEVSK